MDKQISNSGLQAYYDRFEAAKRAVRAANRLGKEERSRAFALYNKHRAALRQVQTGKKTMKPEAIDFMTTANGMPCGVVIDSFTSDDMEYHLVDTQGYRAEWLESRMPLKDKHRVESEIFEHQRKECEWQMAM